MIHMRPLFDRICVRPPSFACYWLSDDIAISRAPSARDVRGMQRAGVRSVLDMRLEAADRSEHFDRRGMRYLRLPVAEGSAPTLDELRLVTDWILERMNDGPVLVHCREGRGRSALVACAVLLRQGAPLFNAYQTLRRARPEASLSDEQADALAAFAAMLETRTPQLSR
jgi:protein-tyrosine phosphatase